MSDFGTRGPGSIAGWGPIIHSVIPFTILGLWVLGLAVSNINESQLQTYESKTLFLMTSLQYHCIPGLPEIKMYAQKMQDAQVKSLYIVFFYFFF